MRISTTAVDEFHTTRLSSLILCNLVFNSLKVMSVLKENLNKNAADRMVIWKQDKSVSYLQLVSTNISISTTQMKIHINLTQDDRFREFWDKFWENYAKTWFNQPARKLKKCVIWLKKIAKMVRWTTNNSLWLMWHEQIKEINMKMKTDKGSSLLEQKNLPPEARKVWTEIDELKSEEELTTELRKLWYLKDSAK